MKSSDSQICVSVLRIICNSFVEIFDCTLLVTLLRFLKSSTEIVRRGFVFSVNGSECYGKNTTAIAILVISFILIMLYAVIVSIYFFLKICGRKAHELLHLFDCDFNVRIVEVFGEY